MYVLLVTCLCAVALGSPVETVTGGDVELVMDPPVFETAEKTVTPVVETVEVVPVVETVVPTTKTTGLTKFETKAIKVISSLGELQVFERTYMANPFPVDEHFRIVFDAMVRLGIEKTELEGLRGQVFGNLEMAQKATFKHSYEIGTLVTLMESVIEAAKFKSTDKGFFERRKIAIKEVASVLRDELTDIRANIALGLSGYTGTIKALTDAYTTPESAIVKRHLKFVLFVYELGHGELDDLLAKLEEDCKQFIAEYEDFLNDIAAAVDEFVTDVTSDTTSAP